MQAVLQDPCSGSWGQVGPARGLGYSTGSSPLGLFVSIPAPPLPQAEGNRLANGRPQHHPTSILWERTHQWRRSKEHVCDSAAGLSSPIQPRVEGKLTKPSVSHSAAKALFYQQPSPLWGRAGTFENGDLSFG